MDKTFLENFGVIADAPNGIAQLREVVLSLAISGSLTSSKIDSWKKTTLGNEVEIVRGITFPASAKERTPRPGLVACLRTANVQSEVDWEDLLYVSEAYVRKPEQFIQQNDLLISMANSRELVGKVALVRDLNIHCTLGGFIAAIRCKSELLPKFLMSVLRIPKSREQLIDSSTQTTNIANISLGRIRPFELLLPTVEEQVRIVSKVDELMALCDELEAEKAKRETLRTASRGSAIDAISTATTPEELSTAWSRISNNWNAIADSRPALTALRQLTLSLAVRGLLGTAHAADEDASAFIRMFDDGMPVPVRVGPYSIPPKWRWAHFGDVSINRDSQRIPVSKTDRELRQGPYDYYGASGVIDSIDDFIFDETLMLIGEDGANLINRSTPIAFIAKGKYWVNNHAHVIGSVDETALSYLSLAINAIDLKPYVTGTAQPKLNQAKLNKIPIPVPPFAEQERIVTKVNQLMALYAELETALNTRTQIESSFAGALSQLLAV